MSSAHPSGRELDPSLDEYDHFQSSGASSEEEGRPGGRERGTPTDSEASAIGLKLLLTNSQASALIGKRGVQIRAIQANSSARVKVANAGDCFPGTNDRAVLITGSLHAINTALDLVLNRLYSVCARVWPGFLQFL